MKILISILLDIVLKNGMRYIMRYEVCRVCHDIVLVRNLDISAILKFLFLTRTEAHVHAHNDSNECTGTHNTANDCSYLRTVVI